MQGKNDWQIERNDLNLIRVLGRGHFGEVWYGRYQGGEVAIKKLYNGLLPVKYILQEMETLTHLRHPNIIYLYGVAVDDKSQVFIVTDYVSGGNLREKIKSDSYSSLSLKLKVKYSPHHSIHSINNCNR